MQSRASSPQSPFVTSQISFYIVLPPPTFYSQNDQGESLAADKDSP